MSLLGRATVCCFKVCLNEQPEQTMAASVHLGACSVLLLPYCLSSNPSLYAFKVLLINDGLLKIGPCLLSGANTQAGHVSIDVVMAQVTIGLD